MLWMYGICPNVCQSMSYTFEQSENFHEIWISCC